MSLSWLKNWFKPQKSNTEGPKSLFGKVNSVQEACTKCFAVHILTFEILQITWKNKTKNIRLLVFSFWSIDFIFWSLFCFFMWFARLQILICEPQSLWHKLLVLSWLYHCQPFLIYNEWAVEKLEKLARYKWTSVVT